MEISNPQKNNPSSSYIYQLDLDSLEKDYQDLHLLTYKHSFYFFSFIIFLYKLCNLFYINYWYYSNSYFVFSILHLLLIIKSVLIFKYSNNYNYLKLINFENFILVFASHCILIVNLNLSYGKILLSLGYTYVLIIIVGLSNIFYCSFSEIAKIFSFFTTLSFLILVNVLCDISLINEIILHIFFFVVCFYIYFQKENLQTLQFTKFKEVKKKYEILNSILEGMSSVILICENENSVVYNTNLQDINYRNIEEMEIVKNELDQRSRSMTINNNGIIHI
jgi:hypothetical protein